ncbi:LolA family protein [Allosphingosinicella vermicomposti]|uniref:LolA family protein n=1 Tax=Allosphingosinicella vermicomposti TaxID=614671 RepID=UPI000D10DF81|nr:outer membrane lipoprotein carrier protein LolA [Allosphingosinicella vermicomposti]
MTRFLALSLAAVPLAASAVTPAAAVTPVMAINQVQSHLKAVNTMTANFSQTGRGGQTLTGTLSLKRPGKIRFQYQKGVPMLIVGDGKSLAMIDYEVNQVQRWPIGGSPLAVLLNPNQDLSRVAKVTRNDGQVMLVQARDPKRPEFGTITLSFAKVASGPAGLVLSGWTTRDAQNNVTTVRLSGHRFNVAVADSLFRYADPRRKGPKG